MSEGGRQPLAFIVRQAPYAQRSPRAQLDVALAAASLEIPLEIYFLGAGVWQLAVRRDPEVAGLPRGLKGWAAVADMTPVRFFAEAGACARLVKAKADWLVNVEPLDLVSMASRWRACERVMAL